MEKNMAAATCPNTRSKKSRVMCVAQEHRESFRCRREGGGSAQDAAVYAGTQRGGFNVYVSWKNAAGGDPKSDDQCLRLARFEVLCRLAELDKFADVIAVDGDPTERSHDMENVKICHEGRLGLQERLRSHGELA